MKNSFFYRGQHVYKPGPTERVLNLAGFVLLAVFIFSTGMAVKTYCRGEQEQRAFEQLSVEKRQLEAARSDKEPAPELSAEAQLQSRNPDFAAWLTVEGADID